MGDSHPLLGRVKPGIDRRREFSQALPLNVRSPSPLTSIPCLLPEASDLLGDSTAFFRHQPALSFHFSLFSFQFSRSLFPFDGAGGFGADVVDDAVDGLDFVDDAVGDAGEEIVG